MTFTHCTAQIHLTLAAVTPPLPHPERHAACIELKLKIQIFIYTARVFIISLFVHFLDSLGNNLINLNSLGVQYLCTANFIFLWRQITVFILLSHIESQRL